MDTANDVREEGPLVSLTVRRAESIDHRAVLAVRFPQLFAEAEGNRRREQKGSAHRCTSQKGSVSVWLMSPLGEQACESAEHEDVRTLWVSLDEHGERWKEWKQVCLENQSHSFGDGWSEYHEVPNCTFDLFWNWGRNGSDPMI